MLLFGKKPSTRDLIEALAKQIEALARQTEESRAELAARIEAETGRLEREIGHTREEHLSLAIKFDQLHAEFGARFDAARGNLDIARGEIKHELAATREEHLSLAIRLDQLQADVERSAFAFAEVHPAVQGQLLETAEGPAYRQLRLAIMSTPRSGSTWLRLMLGHYYHLQEKAIDLPSELGDLPHRSIAQLHWPPQPDLLGVLAAQNIKPLVMLRHPLDVLVSVLHFVTHEPRTANWLDGAAMIPPDLAGKSPLSSEFRDYCLSEGAANILGVSRDWLRVPEAIHCRYEDLVADTVGALRRLRKRIGVRGVLPLDQVASAVTMEKMRSLANNHGWVGKPGHWRKLVLPELAHAILDRHRDVFDSLGYEIGSYELGENAARRHWESISIAPAGDRTARVAAS